MSETPNDPGQPAGSEPTGEPPGYWESRAAAEPPQPSPGVQFNPQSAYPANGSAQPPYPGTPYPSQPTYPPAGYPQPGYGQPVYGYQGYPPYAGYAKPEHPQANTALIVGIIGLAGGLTFCGVPLLASPFAWMIGQRAKNEIDREPDRWSGREHANTGMILGMIGTGLLALALAGIVLFVLLAATNPFDFERY